MLKFFFIFQLENEHWKVETSLVYVAKCNLGKVNLEPMRPAVSRICGVAAMACFDLCLLLSARRQNCGCLLRLSLRITTLDGSLIWSPYLLL